MQRCSLLYEHDEQNMENQLNPAFELAFSNDKIGFVQKARVNTLRWCNNQRIHASYHHEEKSRKNTTFIKLKYNGVYEI
jgi:hypothetical protein